MSQRRGLDKPPDVAASHRDTLLRAIAPLHLQPGSQPSLLRVTVTAATVTAARSLKSRQLD
jgi:hypothetical protein